MPPYPEVFAYSTTDDPLVLVVGTFGGDARWRSDNGAVLADAPEPLELKQETFDGSQLIQPHEARRFIDVDTKGRV